MHAVTDTPKTLGLLPVAGIFDRSVMVARCGCVGLGGETHGRTWGSVLTCAYCDIKLHALDILERAYPGPTLFPIEDRGHAA